MTQVWTHASELITGRGVVSKDGRHPVEADLCVLEDGAIAFAGGKIQWVGRTRDLPKKYLRSKKKNLKNQSAVIPGLIDCHTHLVFSGNRAEEFALRCGGATYEQIAKKGGGIQTTVQATRAASEAELEKLALGRIKEAHSYGIRTLEIKSGYALNLEGEIKILRVIKKLQSRFKDMTLVSTFLGAHAFPRDVSKSQYLDDLLNKMLPKVAEKKLAQACDVFIDDGYFSISDARVLLKKAQKLGLKVKIHADELGCSHSAELAVELGALSADHLLKVSEEGIKKLGQSQTVAVLLPGTAFYLKAAHAPARKLIDAGACIALSTDFNPGTSMTLNLPAVMTIAALYLQLSRAELFASVTYNAAKALGLEKKKGALIAGYDADVVALPFKKFEELYYRFAWNSSF